MRAEVSLATASAMREKALLDYREARCKGAAWLWLRATKRAGGSRTIALMTLHLWHNYCVSSIARRAQVEEIVHRYDMRRKRFMIRQWLRAAKKQRRERQLEMEKVMREAELFEAKEATRVAEARAEDLNRRAESARRRAAASRCTRAAARAAAVESLPTYQEMTNWKTAFVDGRQLARIVFAELEALLRGKGVERAEGVNLKGRKTLLGYRGTGPRLWQRGVDQGALQSFASDVRGRLDRPNDLAKLLEKGGSRLIDHDQDIAPDGVVGKYRYTKREMAKVRDRWARLRADLEVPAPDPELPDEDLIPLLPKSAIAKLLPPPAAMQTAEDDAAQDAGIGDMVQLTVDAANMMEAVGELEADEWRNSILWDHVRNTVDNKAFSELAPRRIVPGPRFEGNVARDPAEARAPAAAA
ncbi:hypothetical protein JL720_9395 [Aureococcus anophagefferens]|nr:hypothetical protein JL720_9395 [Aureococcus anophagefferens]